MKTSAEVCNPKQVEITLSSTMTLGEWEQVRDSLLGGRYPVYTAMSHLEGAISDLIRRMTKTLIADTPAATKQVD